MDDGTYTKRCFYYRDKDKRVLVRINEKTIKNIELISNDSRTNIHSYTNSGAGSAILGGLIAGDTGFATGALLSRKIEVYSTYESKYTVLITLKNNKVILVECDDQEKNELFFLKSKLTDKEVEVEETKIFSEIEKDFWKFIDERNKMYKKINFYISREHMLDENCLVEFFGAIFFIISAFFYFNDELEKAVLLFLLTILCATIYFYFNILFNKM